ncbi:MAG: hypothetical protein WB610_11865, partial [Rhodomicrobium sp.]
MRSHRIQVDALKRMATAERSEIDALRRAARNRKGLGNGRALDKLTLIQIDFCKVRLAVELHTDEIMLAPWVVVVIERIEGPNLLHDRVALCDLKRRHPGRHHHAASPETLPEGIVQGAYLRALGIFVFFLYFCLGFKSPASRLDSVAASLGAGLVED